MTHRITLIARDWARDPIAPRTKKNSGRMIRPGLFLPSKAYAEWVNALPAHSVYDKYAPPIKARLNVRALVYRKANIGDADGYYNAIGDALQAMRIIANDRQIASWDGSRLLKDPANPRVEIELTEVAEGE